VRDLSVKLDNTLALEHIDLRVTEGTFLGLIGPNGGGKTTLLKCILGLLKPDSGTVLVMGEPAGHPRTRGLLGYVPQEPVTDFGFPVSIYDVVMMGRYPRLGPFRRATSEDHEAVRKALNQVGVAELANRAIGALSGGQRQRAFIARALSSEPRILLLDEPMAGVDAKAQNQFYRLLGKLREELSLTVVLVSHDIGVIPYYTEEIACVNQTLHLHGKPDEVLTSESLRQAYGCEVELLVHGKIPHRVVEEHSD
jgi:zinc transport system ATP-binding protein